MRATEKPTPVSLLAAHVYERYCLRCLCGATTSADNRNGRMGAAEMFHQRGWRAVDRGGGRSEICCAHCYRVNFPGGDEAPTP